MFQLFLHLFCKGEAHNAGHQRRARTDASDKPCMRDMLIARPLHAVVRWRTQPAFGSPRFATCSTASQNLSNSFSVVYTLGVTRTPFNSSCTILCTSIRCYFHRYCVKATGSTLAISKVAKPQLISGAKEVWKRTFGRCLIRITQ